MLNIIAGVALAVIGSPEIAYAQSLQLAYEEVASTTPIGPKTRLEALVDEAAAKYDIDPEPLYKTLWCESRGVEKAVGDDGLALGVAQIRTDYHPNITRRQSFDMEWSVDWAAKQFANGNADWWTCYRNL
jgi:hypothetical protein